MKLTYEMTCEELDDLSADPIAAYDAAVSAARAADQRHEAAVKALVEAVTNRIKWGGHSDACKSIRWANGECNCGQDQIISALAPFMETKE